MFLFSAIWNRCSRVSKRIEEEAGLKWAMENEGARPKCSDAKWQVSYQQLHHRQDSGVKVQTLGTDAYVPIFNITYRLLILKYLPTKTSFNKLRKILIFFYYILYGTVISMRSLKSIYSWKVRWSVIVSNENLTHFPEIFSSWSLSLQGKCKKH